MRVNTQPYKGLYIGTHRGFCIYCLCDIHIHEDKVAHTAAHNEQVEDFVGTEVFVSGVEQGKLQCIDDAPYGINNTTSQ